MCSVGAFSFFFPLFTAHLPPRPLEIGTNSHVKIEMDVPTAVFCPETVELDLQASAHSMTEGLAGPAVASGEDMIGAERQEGLWKNSNADQTGAVADRMTVSGLPSVSLLPLPHSANGREPSFAHLPCWPGPQLPQLHGGINAMNYFVGQAAVPCFTPDQCAASDTVQLQMKHSVVDEGNIGQYQQFSAEAWAKDERGLFPILEHPVPAVPNGNYVSQAASEIDSFEAALGLGQQFMTPGSAMTAYESAGLRPLNWSAKPLDTISRTASNLRIPPGPAQEPPSVKRTECSVCGKLFSSAGNLKRHSVIHSKARPYKCEICGKRFTQKGHVRTHQSVHTGQRPYGCDICGKFFSQFGHLNSHIVRHKKGGLQGKTIKLHPQPRNQMGPGEY